MAWYQSPFTLVNLTASVVSILVALYVRSRQRSPEARSLSYALMACAVWTVAYGIELASPDLESKLLWVKLQYPGITLAPAFFFVFVAQYTGRSGWMSRRNVAALFTEPVVIVLLAFTNDYHRLLWTRNYLAPYSEWPLLLNVYGPAGWTHIVYSYVLLGTATIMLMRTLWHAPGRGKASGLLTVLLVPWMASAMYVSGYNPFPGLDLTPLGFVTMGSALVWGVSGLRLEGLLSVSRRAIVDQMRDGVLVLDLEDRVAEMNPGAQRLLERPEASVLGRKVSTVWTEWPDFQHAAGKDGRSESLEMTLVREQTRVFDVQISPVVDWRGVVVSRVATIRDVTERKRLQEELALQYEMARYLADRDPVTSLLNHRAIHRRLEQEVKLSLRTGQPFSMIMMDLDGFKRVNDDNGHPVGDQVLLAVASILRDTVRETDLLARYGGDEFVAILPSTGVDGAVELARRLRDALSCNPYAAEEAATIELHMSYGIATCPCDARDASHLVEVADSRLYESKHRGNDIITSATSTPDAV